MKNNMHTLSKQQKIAETVLDYWYTLEFLSQDTLPGLSYEERRKNDEAAKAFSAETGRPQASVGGKSAPKVLKLITTIEADTDICGRAASEAQRHGMSCWGNISVYVGKLKREHCTQAIARKLQEEDLRPEVSNDEIACFSIQLTPTGGYIEKTFSLSPMIWAISRLERSKGKNLAQYLSHQAYREVVEAYDRQLIKWDSAASEKPASAAACQIAGIFKQVCDQFMKGAPESDDEFSCMMIYQVFKDENEREKYDDDEYLGLGRNFFAEDLKMVLSGFQTGLSDLQSPMMKSMIHYIVGPYAEAYPEEALFSFEGRHDLEHPETGDNKGDHLRAVLADILDVRNAPLGKWPSRFMPALMQQAAVNLAVSERADNGRIFSVNGPPGTGKTTLLKEIVVDHIIKKAMYLSEYEKPDDAFEECFFLHGEKVGNGYSKWYPKYYRLKDERINDCSILVTSCNNAAVENITKELPLEKGISGALSALGSDGQACREQLKEVKTLFTAAASGRYEELFCNDKTKKGRYQDIYFTEYAKSLLNGDEAWGLISAALGKKSNIHRFYQNVLYHLIADFHKNNKVDARLEHFGRIRKEFQEQKKKVERMREELDKYCREEANTRRQNKECREHIRKLCHDTEQKTITLIECEKQTASLRKESETYGAKLAEKEREAGQARCVAGDSRKAFEEMDLRYEEKLKLSIAERRSIRPFGKLFHKEDTKAKQELADKFYQEAQELKHRAEELRSLFEADQSVSDSLEAQADSLRREMVKRSEMLKILGGMEADLMRGVEKNREETDYYEQSMVTNRDCFAGKLKDKLKAADDTGRFIPLDDDFMEQFLSAEEKESTWAQVSNPWFTDHYNREREKLFFLALQVNQSFILSSRCCFRNYRNLALLWQESKEENEIITFHPEDREACYGPLLQTLFLLVPVISTTFASVGLFLRDIREPNILGTLIVDEAGQAPPQMAIGALYRSRRAVIVGDPKQVEPVVTDDLQLLKRAFQENVYKPYKAKTISVQQFADRINPYGTYMENDDNEREWLGCPLVVHRRCISPMYDISNQISYNNTMKQQTGAPSKEKEKLFCYGGSQWINVKGREKGNKNHFVENQAKRVIEILEIAFSKSDDPSLFIITPFTTVKFGMIKYLEGKLKTGDSSILNEKRSSVKEWMYKNIGTVHTFQGKEANEVIFLLGCDTSREAAGAIRWVNANIVNVAVTRAKYRLYVIGDEIAWRESSYIRRAKSVLDLYAIKELGRIVSGDQEAGEEEKREAAVAFSRQLPTAEFVSMESVECESDETDYIFESEIYLEELKNEGQFLNEITEEQLKGYGFTRESFQALNPRVRENVEWGIRLYSMFKKLRKRYEIEEMDVSCCAILFCKAIELQIKECFFEGLKMRLPEFQINGPGKGKTPFCSVKKKETTIGTYCHILHNDANKQNLAKFMAGLQKARYNKAWWDQFDIKLNECRELRNNCCHCDKFTWKQMNRLLVLLFLNADKSKNPAVDGVIRESEAGKLLLVHNSRGQTT